MGGKADVTLGPGNGLRELKKVTRETFGKARCQKLGKLTLLDGKEVTMAVGGAALRPGLA